MQLFVAFTGSWAFIYNYPRQFYDVYPALDFSGRLELHHRPRASHMYYDESERNWLLDALVRWANTNFA